MVAVTGFSDHDITLRAGPLANLPALMRAQGHDPGPVFQDCGFQLDDFADPDNRLPFIKASKLFEHCADVTGIDHLGLELGKMATPSHMGVVGFVLGAAPTAREALQSLVQHIDLHDEGGIVSLNIGSRHTSLRYSLILAGTCAVEQIYDMAAVMMYKIMRKISGPKWQPDSVNLARRQPADTSPYQKFFYAPVHFNAQECSITFQNRWLDSVPEGHDALLYQHLMEEAQQVHETTRRSLMEQVPICLHKGLLCGQFSSHQIAAALGMHERTLHRRLKASGTGFRQELDRARQTLSEELLASTSLPVSDIANTLGYADASSFIRAFQRWSNTSPSAWRRQHQKVPGAAVMRDADR